MPVDPNELAKRVLYATSDPLHEMSGHPLPGLTTLLYRVCKGDPEVYEEATRIVDLFIETALRGSSSWPRRFQLRFERDQLSMRIGALSHLLGDPLLRKDLAMQEIVLARQQLGVMLSYLGALEARMKFIQAKETQDESTGEDSGDETSGR